MIVSKCCSVTVCFFFYLVLRFLFLNTVNTVVHPTALVFPFVKAQMVNPGWQLDLVFVVCSINFFFLLLFFFFSSLAANASRPSLGYICNHWFLISVWCLYTLKSCHFISTPFSPATQSMTISINQHPHMAVYQGFLPVTQTFYPMSHPESKSYFHLTCCYYLVACPLKQLLHYSLCSSCFVSGFNPENGAGAVNP